MSNVKDLTRKSLESAYETQEKRLMAENMKNEVVKKKLREFVTVIANEVSGQTKRKVNGKMRALIAWLEGNAQFQFQEEIKSAEARKLITYNNILVLIFGFTGGTLLGFLLGLVAGVEGVK